MEDNDSESSEDLAKLPTFSDISSRSREVIGGWVTKRFDRIDKQYRREIARLREEHPSPIFRRMVKRMAAMGTSPSRIAQYLEIKYTDLQSHYGDVLLSGVTAANMAVAETMFSIATDRDHPGAVKVGVEWLHRRGADEWRPPAQKLEVEASQNGPPIIDSSKLTAHERQQLREMIMRIEAGGTAGEIEDQSVVSES